MIRILLYLFLVGSAVEAQAQNSTRKYVSHNLNGSNLAVKTSDGTYQIRFYSKDIIETTFLPEGEMFNSESHAVVLTPTPVNINPLVSNNEITIATAGISLKITLSPFQLSYSYEGKPLLSEKNGYTKRDSTETIDFNITPAEVLYGGGARVLGMNRRGNRLQLYNRAHYGYETRSELMNFAMPLILSSKIYAVHFDNAPIGYLDLDSKNTNTIAYETISGRKTYQVIAGSSWQELIDNYTDLTGKQPMPPRWAFGNFASRFGYHSERETRETVARFEKEKIPLDAIILDLYWFGKDVKETMGNLAFDRDSFPSAEQMIADFNRKGIKTILITEPFILTTSKRWHEAVSKNILATDNFGKPFTYDFYFGNTGLIDIFKPEGNNWFWDIYKDLSARGVAGWWGDLGEPEVHPSALRHATGTADELHNIYGHQWAKLVFDGYRRDFPEQRPFILMRSGYSGSQRFGMIPWSGDVSRSWGGLSGQPEISLQMGMQGMGYMHSDLGGFAGANLDNELYTRWLQYGVFQPIFRPHAQEDVASEPVFRDAKTMALAKESILLRYRLLPYNYNLAFENHTTGMPLMRPLFFEEPDNIQLLASAETYLWGNDFLVAPVLKSGETQKSIYFPKSSNWFDFATDQKYAAGTTSAVNVVADHIPVFVRGGAFIPMAAPVSNTSEYNLDDLNLHYYYDGDAENNRSTLYNDNGIKPNSYEQGVFEMFTFRSAVKKSGLLLSLNLEAGTTKTTNKKINLTVHAIEKKPRKVSINGKRISFKYNSTKKVLTLETILENDKTVEIQIQKKS